MKKPIALILSSIIALNGCAGRKANPVAEVQARDTVMSCRELIVEMKVNNDAIVGLVEQRDKTKNNNAVAVGVGAIIFFPALFFMNLKGADKAEALAYQRRNAGLASRYKAKGCKPDLVMKPKEPKEPE